MKIDAKAARNESPPPGPAQTEGNETILLVGSGRSGTTFLAKLIDSHPDVLYRHEPDSVRVNDTIPFLPPDHFDDEIIRKAREYLDRLQNIGTARTSGRRPVFKKSFRSEIGNQAHRLASLSAVRLEKIPGISNVPVPDFVPQNKAGTVRCLIKTVGSMWRTRLFAQAQPSLRIVHLVRHPCGVVASRLRGIQTGRMQENTFLDAIFDAIFDAGRGQRYGLTIGELRAKSLEERIAFAWMAVNQQIYDDLHRFPNYRVVIYETLCSNLADESAGLFDFLGLDPNRQTAHFIASLKRMGDNRRYFSIRRSPTSALTTWRQELSEDQTIRIEKMVARSELGERLVGAAPVGRAASS